MTDKNIIIDYINNNGIDCSISGVYFPGISGTTTTQSRYISGTSFSIISY